MNRSIRTFALVLLALASAGSVHAQQTSDQIRQIPLQLVRGERIRLLMGGPTSRPVVGIFQGLRQDTVLMRPEFSGEIVRILVPEGTVFQRPAPSRARTKWIIGGGLVGGVAGGIIGYSFFNEETRENGRVCVDPPTSSGLFVGCGPKGTVSISRVTTDVADVLSKSLPIGTVSGLVIGWMITRRPRWVDVSTGRLNVEFAPVSRAGIGPSFTLRF